MSVQGIGYLENAFYTYQALRGEFNRKSADIGFKLAIEIFGTSDYQRSERFSTYSLRFYETQDQQYVNKIVELMILQLRITVIKQNSNSSGGNTAPNPAVDAVAAKRIGDIWSYMSTHNYRELYHVSAIMKEYVEYYLSRLDQEIKFFLSQQFEIILSRLIKINVLDSLQQVDNQQKSKDILLNEIFADPNNNNNPYRLIERTFLIIAEDGQKRNSKRANTTDGNE